MKIQNNQARLNIHKIVQESFEGCEATYIQILSSPNFQRKLRQIAYKYSVGNSLQWQDTYQSAQLKILEAVKEGKFNRQLGGFYQWALTVGKYCIIDLIRKEKRKYAISLDQDLEGTEMAIHETITDNFNILEHLEKTELMSNLFISIQKLESKYPDRGYNQLWQAKLTGKTQQEIAREMKITQSAVSKRWKEFVARLGMEMKLYSQDLF